jgi:predicted regulator of Ras-like GTPase activity (Roadblock/LC7/MglB family)
MAMQGNLRDMSVADIIQVNCQDKKTAEATITSNGKEARLFFFDGNVTHAEMGNVVGEEVIYQILAWDQGEFTINPGVTHPTSSIKRNWSGLLLEGAKRLDETEPDAGLELDLGISSVDQKESLIKGLLQKYIDRFPTMDSICIVGIDGYIKYAIHKNMVDEDVLGAVGTAVFNLGKRSLGLLRMDSFGKSILSGANNTILVCTINRYSLLVGLYSSSINKSSVEWNNVDELITDLSTLL